MITYSEIDKKSGINSGKRGILSTKSIFSLPLRQFFE